MGRRIFIKYLSDLFYVTVDGKAFTHDDRFIACNCVKWYIGHYRMYFITENGDMLSVYYDDIINRSSAINVRKANFHVNPYLCGDSCGYDDGLLILYGHDCMLNKKNGKWKLIDRQWHEISYIFEISGYTCFIESGDGYIVVDYMGNSIARIKPKPTPSDKLLSNDKIITYGKHLMFQKSQDDMLITLLESPCKQLITRGYAFFIALEDGTVYRCHVEDEKIIQEKYSMKGKIYDLYHYPRDFCDNEIILEAPTGKKYILNVNDHKDVIPIDTCLVFVYDRYIICDKKLPEFVYIPYNAHTRFYKNINNMCDITFLWE